MISPDLCHVAPAYRFANHLARRLLPALCLLSLLAPPAAAVQPREVLPRDADPAVSGWLEPHLVYFDPQGPVRDQLLVFLPGSRGVPQRAQTFLGLAADLGFHVIGLRYPNSWSLSELCNFSSDPDCFETVRSEILYGVDQASLVEIPGPDSIEARLVSAIALLDERFPAEAWGQYLAADSPKWQRLVLTGVSQGGGHAALLARDQQVARVVLFASPADYSPLFGRLASWIFDPHVTAGERYWGFSHLQDRWQRRLEAWAGLGLGAFGAPVVIEELQPPYGESHQLTTDAEPRVAGEFHGSVVADDLIPLDATGAPLFADAWVYLLTADSSGTASASTFSFVEVAISAPETDTSVAVKISRHGGTQGVGSVDYATVGGTAEAGNDFLTTAGTLTWSNGEGGTKSVDIPLVDDSEIEGLEELSLMLSNPVGGTISGSSTVPISLIDDEEAATPCVAADTTLCLGAGGRFRAELAWRDFSDRHGAGRTVDIGREDSGLFFFSTRKTSRC